MESDPGREGCPIALQTSDAWEAAVAGEAQMTWLTCIVSALEAETKGSSGPAWARDSEVWASLGYRDHLIKKTDTGGGCSGCNSKMWKGLRLGSAFCGSRSLWESGRSRK